MKTQNRLKTVIKKSGVMRLPKVVNSTLHFFVCPETGFAKTCVSAKLSKKWTDFCIGNIKLGSEKNIVFKINKRLNNTERSKDEFILC